MTQDDINRMESRQEDYQDQAVWTQAVAAVLSQDSDADEDYAASKADVVVVLFRNRWPRTHKHTPREGCP